MGGRPQRESYGQERIKSMKAEKRKQKRLRGPRRIVGLTQRLHHQPLGPTLPRVLCASASKKEENSRESRKGRFTTSAPATVGLREYGAAVESALLPTSRGGPNMNLLL